ncbi:MAG: hypothetical protein V7637_3590 [Mycobacteriales bacterium]
MTDQIAGGPGWARQAPEPRAGSGGHLPRAPRGVGAGPKVALLAVVGLLFGYVLTHRYTPPPAAAPVAAPVSTGPLPALPWLGGRPGTGPPGLRLLAGDRTPRLVDAHTGQVTPPPGLDLWPESVVSVFALRPGTLAAVTEPYGGAGGRFLVRPGAQPLLLGTDAGVLPSRDGQLILTVYRRGGTTVTGLTLGRRLRWQWQLPGLAIAVRDTPAGLVVEQYDGPHGRAANLLLLDPKTGAVRREIGRGDIAASSDTTIAWTPADCPDACSLVVTTLAGGATRRYAMPIYWRPDRGAFAPDGRTLALTFPATGRIGVSRPGFVVMLDLTLTTFTRVRDLRTGSGLGAEVGWSPDGGYLVIAVNWPDHQQFALWRAGRLTVLPTVLPGQPGPLTVLA